MFQVGSKVRWVSQANGSVREKIGIIRQVVSEGKLPDRDRFLSLYKGSGVGYARQHESYIVEVPNKRKGVKFYWPLVKNLKLVDMPSGGSDAEE